MTNIFSTPRQQVVIYPFKHRFLHSNEDAKLLAVNRQEITNFVVETNYTKSKENPSGTFYIILSNSRDWQYVLKPGDWLTIHQSQINLSPKTTQGLMCFGSVDRVSKIKSYDGDGKRVITYKVEGRDFGKIFEETKFYFNPYVNNSSEASLLTILPMLGSVQLGHPVKLFCHYFNLYYGGKDPAIQVQQFKQTLNQVLIPKEIMALFGATKPEARFSDIVRLKFGEDGTYHYLKDAFVQDILKTTLQQRSELDQRPSNIQSLFPEGFALSMPLDLVANNSFWDILRTIANLSMNELYTSMEYYPLENKVVPTIIFRKIPFRKGLYTKLTTIQAGDDELRDEDLGYADGERINYIQLDSESETVAGYQSILALAKDGQKFKGFKYLTPGKEEREGVPYLDITSIQRYGYRPLNLTTSFCYTAIINNGEKQSSPNLDLYKDWMTELIEIWSNSDRFESGTLILNGFSRVLTVGKKEIITDALSVGQNIYLYNKRKLFHIESYSRTWKAPGNLMMSLTLSRGVTWDGNGNHQFIDENPTDYTSNKTMTVIKKERRR